MRKMLVAGLAAGLLTSLTPAAQAHPNYHYAGRCVLATVNDTTPGGRLGGPTQWNGAAAVAAVATNASGLPDTTLLTSARCDLYINGAFVMTLVTAAGPGVAVGASSVAFIAHPTDVIVVCEEVDVAGDQHTSCTRIVPAQAVPQPVIDLVDGVLAAAYSVVKPVTDPLLCPVLALAAPGVPPALGIDSQGDVYIYGDRVFDCPPYAVGPPLASTYAPYALTLP